VDQNTMLVAVTTTVVGCLTAIIVVFSLTNAYRKRNQAGPSGDQLLRLEDRIARIEQGIESIAVEVERISEGQRFTTKLLAEREEPSRIPR
jgi:hypothetical protein